MLSLNGEWSLRYRTENIGEEWKNISAQVPGNVELDLARAGIEDDPFYGENLYHFRPYEFCEWEYERSFFLAEDMVGEMLELVLEGVNLYAQVYINDCPVGSCENMLIEHVLDITEAAHPGAVNTIRIHIASALNHARADELPVLATGNDGSVEYVRQRKPPHSFGWDIMPRFPSAGLWRGVSIRRRKATRITQSYYATVSADEKRAQLRYSVRFETDAATLEGFTLRISGDGFAVERPLLFTAADGSITVENPRLWWPRGYGDANLYNVTLELLHRGEVVDSKTERIGIRKVEIEQVMKPGDEGEFLIRVNGCPILAKGSNWVPLDAMHSRDASRYEQAIALFSEAGCNIVRCWGGNVYEDHRFFELCDEQGLMVWQDFAMACALYPQEDALFHTLEEEAASVIKKLRNHPSIILWAGDNEVDEFYCGMGFASKENCYNAITREVLPRAVRNHDPYRLFLPSSPYIPPYIERYDVPEQHNWGARAYFKDDFYKHSRAHFISECGYHGCPSPESLARFIPADKLWPWDNDVWETHNTDYLPAGRRGYNRNQLMADQVQILFGAVPDTLEEFSLLSQVSQAEAKKFFIERTRIKKWRRTGIIWWNMLDGWPQISDAVVDYYFAKKRAFGYITRVQQPICLMMDELEDWTHRIVLGNDSRGIRNVEWRVLDGDTDAVLLAGSCLSPANENVTVGELRILPGSQKLYLLEWTVDGKTGGNHYITGFPPYDAAVMKQWLSKIDALPSDSM
ncbi:MAG: glycoside hydrolase family 2 protein [Oscillospiraceae bacterium]